MTRLILSTRNAHKAREFGALMAPYEVAELPAGASRRSLARFSSSVAPSPAYRALRTPGAPPRASAAIPLSSANAGAPVACAAARALPSAFSANVSPVSGGSSTSSGSGTTSCGVVDGTPVLDLDYGEDSTAEVDANVVMTGDGGLIEVQATAERTPLSRASLDELLALAEHGITQLREAQSEAVGGGLPQTT